MSFYEKGLTWPFYLFIYRPPHPCQMCTVESSQYPGIGRDWHTPLKHTQKNHTLPNTLSNQHQCPPPPLFSIDHLALSSINLQNALFKLLINTLIDLPKCHRTLRQEPLMVVSLHWCSSLQSVSDECQNEVCFTVCQAQAGPMAFGWKCPTELESCFSIASNVKVLLVKTWCSVSGSYIGGWHCKGVKYDGQLRSNYNYLI